MLFEINSIYTPTTAQLKERVLMQQVLADMAGVPENVDWADSPNQWEQER